MSVNKYVIRKNDGNFTTIPNRVLQNLKDYAALGLYCYIASLPAGWSFHRSHLCSHANMGRDRLNKALDILKNHGLVHINHVRDEKGRFAHFDMVVDDGTNFKINCLEKECAPCTEKPLTENPSLDNSSYKGNIINKIEKHKEKKELKRLSASDDAQPKQDDFFVDDIEVKAGDKVLVNTVPSMFDEFWKIYPVKKNKVRAKRIWERKRYDKIATLILADVQNRNLNEVQWKDPQYIPHPSTYLTQERWNDEVTLPKIENKNNKNTALTNMFKEYSEIKKSGIEIPF